MVKKLNKTLIALGVAGALIASNAFAQGSGVKGAGPKFYRGAGIGPEVSQEAKTLKNTENRTEFEESVRELAKDKERIEIHKEQQKSKKKTKQKSKQKKEGTNSTGTITQ